MNLRENIKKLNEEDALKQEALIQKWKDEADANLQALTSQSQSDLPWDEMKGYQAYDAAYAYEKITGHGYRKTPKFMPLWKKMAVASIFTGLIAFTAWMLTENKTAATVYATASAQKTEILSDGSKITMDKYSTVSYNGDRVAMVEGRAFFNVAKKGKQSPFQVHLNKGVVTVLGTRFAVTSLPGETSISIEEGSVKYEYGSRSIILKAGERMKLSNEDIVASPILSGNEFSWKNQLLEFSSTPLDQAIHDINHHYQQELKFAPGVTAGNCLLTSTFKNESLEQIMSELRHLFQIQYHKQGSSYVITFLKC